MVTTQMDSSFPRGMLSTAKENVNRIVLAGIVALFAACDGSNGSLSQGRGTDGTSAPGSGTGGAVGETPIGGSTDVTGMGGGAGSTMTGTTGGAGGVVGGANADDEATITAYCAHLKDCDPFGFAALYDGDADCVSARRGELDRAAQTPDAGRTPDRLRSCYAAYNSASCDSVFLGLPIPECGLVVGTRPAGAGCYANGQCSSLNCAASSGAICGTCVTGSSRGASCLDDSECNGTLYCVNSTCGDLRLLGESCSVSPDCVGKLMCVSGQCTAPLAVGAACTSTTQCGPEASCVGGSCQQDALVALGATCGSRSDGSYAQCAGIGVCSSGTCVAPRAIAQSCSVSGVACANSGRCINSTCNAFDPSACPATGGGTGGSGGSGGSSGSSSCVLSKCSSSGFTYSCGSGSYTSSTSYTYSSSGVRTGSSTTVTYSNGNTVRCSATGSSGSCTGSGGASCAW